MREAFLGVLMAVGSAGLVPAAAAYEWSPSTAVYEYRESSGDETDRSLDSTIIGNSTIHVTRFEDTLLDIARLKHLGYQELIRANPGVDPWLPGDGTWVTIPSRWILPDAPREGLVLNMPEQRLYYYLPGSRVMTFPLGVGREGEETPAGSYRVGQKRTNPIWYVPKSIQAEMEVPRKVVPPGPNNPLGKYWMRLSHTTYGIHGTNNPWAIGRRVTHGCIRLYPEDISFLYPRVPKGTPVRVIYQYAKVGVMEGKAYFQVFRDGVAEDVQLMTDLMAQLAGLNLDTDLRELRRLLIDLPDGVMTPLPSRDELTSDTSRPERTSPRDPRSGETRRTAAAGP
jgi:L,D-transpeptidase ErfK/SrfK